MIRLDRHMISSELHLEYFTRETEVEKTRLKFSLTCKFAFQGKYPHKKDVFFLTMSVSHISTHSNITRLSDYC